MKKFLLYIFFVLTTYFQSLANDADSSRNQSFTPRQKFVLGTLIIQQTGSLYMEYKWWWEENYHPLHFENDGGFNNYSLGIDKLGHLYTSYMYSNILYEFLSWGNFSEKQARRWSTILPFAWALSIEMGDGFSKFAFSPDDLFANSAGIAYALMQKKYPYLQNFKFKFSYFPSSYHLNNGFKGWSLTSDYNGHIYWLSTDVHAALPETLKSYWPKYLNLAIGYGVNNFTETDHKLYGYPLQREFCVGLDFNLNNIKVKNNSLGTLLRMADYYKLPAPGMKKTDSGNWKPELLLLN